MTGGVDANGGKSNEKRSPVAERILDAAGRLYVRRGMAGTDMAAIAEEAGCSRATLYRYFDNRTALRNAFARREARRLAKRIASDVAGVAPRERLLEATIAGLRAVRTHPLLMNWFGEADSVAVAEVATSAELLDSLAEALVGDAADPEVLAITQWLVRVSLSLFLLPGANEDDERAMLERFVMPAFAVRAAAPT
jgi:AcrR family transcriptional regulator